jgi:hypothetical protein
VPGEVRRNTKSGSAVATLFCRMAVVGNSVPGQLATIELSFLADWCPLGQLLQGTSECLAAREHGLEQVAVLFDPLERLAHPEAARRHVLC